MESTALFFRGLVGHYMMFGERLSSFNLYLRAIFERYNTNVYVIKDRFLIILWRLGGMKKAM
jgi:hypothetical protein